MIQFDMDELLYKTVRISTMDGEVYIGEAVGFESGLEAERGFDMLIIDTGERGILRGISQDEVEELVVMDDGVV